VLRAIDTATIPNSFQKKFPQECALVPSSEVAYHASIDPADSRGEGANSRGIGMVSERKCSMTSEAVVFFWTALASLGASVSAVFAAIYTRLTYQLVRIQLDPNVIVYTRADRDRPSIIVLTIENIGRGIAKSISFMPSRAIPEKAYGLSLTDGPPAGVMTDGPLVEGIPALGPGSTRDITWGQYGGLRRALGDEPLRLRFTYHSDKRSFTGDALLEVKSYHATDASAGPHVVAARSLESMANSLEEIRTTLDGFAGRAVNADPQ
jgi:hypothetical protein